ncbi:aspartate dehydrogenase [Sulfitobacter sp. S190]|uniref:aspartate dehydrogenase n=1 Tax=Sulfitobacter sp. S190 TaxID=2867022 RepID=UPI0021A58050|nr:aspartate dehydrogenase [Sulfitobacter sp. S190]UWR23040.1 aspartate dehydrogenase [Sulfitobacter sp. S190]
MPKLGILGHGSMADYVVRALDRSDWQVSHCIARVGREEAARKCMPREICVASDVRDWSSMPDLVIDCAGHAGLVAHAPDVLRNGTPVITASIGALADDDVGTMLAQAARAGDSRLHLASGAIGALDALRAAAAGGLDAVRYIGRKPPAGWRGTDAEKMADLDRLEEPITHFEGTARQAALRYPKNANVAASVALAGLGFDATRVSLIADPGFQGNMHQITAEGAFGHFEFTITGHSLPDTPRTSALAAMSMLAAVTGYDTPVTF